MEFSVAFQEYMAMIDRASDWTPQRVLMVYAVFGFIKYCCLIIGVALPSILTILLVKGRTD